MAVPRRALVLAAPSFSASLSMYSCSPEQSSRQHSPSLTSKVTLKLIGTRNCSCWENSAGQAASVGAKGQLLLRVQILNQEIYSMCSFLFYLFIFHLLCKKWSSGQIFQLASRVSFRIIFFSTSLRVIGFCRMCRLPKMGVHAPMMI